ncbi:imidazole glycerol phosphate synthase subunit HisH 2 [Clostridium gelidum]|uniref:Imidazole glycerol phosphate synthase subunit HisH n=1 Tax=Clostridium gelidum TaxID=704125 RepID=A0ABN6J601_9CLOT|nr:imidazole glycerol phosphate synthase subunit HisH [Clostridium gelidum]BCZ49025.1 imidazole glycerol phosphate synthase subunit HisH 2 [Clostridium gelidum]
MIAIIDYNMGNVASIENILRKIGIEAIITSDPSVIRQADKIILPGVGSFDYGMKNLNDLGLIEVLKEKAIESNTPLLGICLGMQLLTEGSEEGTLQGLGFIKAHTKKFESEYNGEKLRVPHMGWNYIYPKSNAGIFKNSLDNMRFYFVHSYYVECENEKDVLATTEYGNKFASIIGKDNILGVQFHPEKSHKYGMNLLKNFVEMV